MAKPPLKGRAPKKEPRRSRKKAVTAVAKAPAERAYHTSFPGIVKVLAFRGDTDQDICGILGCGTSTFYRWLNLHPTLREALDQGRSEGGPMANAHVVRALYEKATGVVLNEDQVKWVPELDDKGKRTGDYLPKVVKIERTFAPDQAAIEFWLTNKDGGQWKRKTEQTTNMTINLALRRALLELPED